MMMKKYGLIIKVLLISMFAILLSGCGNLLTSEFSSKTDETKFYTITGNIDVDAISAENSSRTGLPTIPSINDNSINFSVSAKMGDETITGTVSGMQYSITLPRGSWTITVIGKKDNNVEILKGSIEVPVTGDTTQQTITLKTINAGTGSLSLTISISKEENLSCGGVKATLYKNSGEESNDVKYLKFNDTDNNLIQLGFNDLPAGTYSIDLEFYQEMTSSTTTEGTYSCKNLLYSHHDTVNIFANLVTNTWTGSGYSEDKTTFTLTKAMINNFAMTTFYVDGTNGDDSYAGTYFAPFATMQAAVNKVIEMNNVSSSSENAPYRILLLSDIEDTSTGDDIYDGSLISIKNYPNPELYLKIASYQNDSCFEIKGASGRRIMNIEEGANVTIENITLTGGNINANGGGVYVQSGIFIMNSGAKINGCKAEGEYAGGGVYLNGGTFTMNGGTISGCSAEQGGGGVCVQGGTFTMTGGTISENKADCGGGIYVADTKNAQGIVVCIGQLTIEGGEISGNSAKYGGGVYIDSGDFTITGGKISENTSSIDGEGGGVYVKDGTFTIKNDALISKNTSCGNGGGVFAKGGKITINGGSISENIFSNYSSGGGGIYLTGTAQLTMTGGKISDNHPKGETSSNTFGGGVYISGESSIFTMTGGEISGNSAYYGGGVAIIGTFSMSGGTIGGETEDLACTAEKGGGVYVAYYNGTESATTFEMSGGAVISSGNDVYLAKEAFIKVTGNLTGTTPVATITPDEYSINRQVITVPVSDDGATSSVTLSDQVGKFAVTPQTATDGATINWYINANGCLELLYSDWSALKTAIEETSNTTSEFVLSGNLTATSTITISGGITLKALDGVDGVITRGEGFTGAFFDNNSTLTLEGITLDGGKNSNIVATAPLITSSGSLTLNNCTLQNNKNTSTTPGGAIYISAGTFTMNGGVIGSEVTENDSLKTYSWQYAADANNYSNYAEAGGGGIYVEDGTVTIDNATISYNYTPNLATNFENKTPSDTAHGGGISIVSGSLSLKGSEVSYNSGYQGGGIRCYQNSDNSSGNILTLEKSKIIGNISNPYYCNGFGGGVMVKNFTVKFEGDTPSVIEENYSGDGGALFLENTNSILQNTTSTLQNITIQNNSYNKNGYKNGSEVLLYSGANVSIGSSNVTIQSVAGETRGIFMNNNNTLNLSGDAKLDTPIYLTNGAMITVSAALTSEGSLVATITPQYYPGDTYVSNNESITVGDVSVLTVGTGVTLSNDIVGRFAVTPQTTEDGTTVNWTIDTEGKLVNNAALNGTIISSIDELKSFFNVTNYVYELGEGTYVLGNNIELDYPLYISGSKNVIIGANTNIELSASFTNNNLIIIETGTLTLGNGAGCLTLKHTSNNKSTIALNGGDGVLTLENNCAITGSQYCAIEVLQGSVYMNGGEIYGNKYTGTKTQSSAVTFGEGGIIYGYFSGGKIYNNETSTSGGAIAIMTTNVNSVCFTIDNTEIYSNTAAGYGGGVYSKNSNLYIYSGAKIYDNVVKGTNQGASIFVTEENIFYLDEISHGEHYTQNIGT